VAGCSEHFILPLEHLPADLNASFVHVPVEAMDYRVMQVSDAAIGA
jgi:hypothetical protein